MSADEPTPRFTAEEEARLRQGLDEALAEEADTTWRYKRAATFIDFRLITPN